ncbi:Cyclin N-terminal domain-containing protein 1 [Myotis brandtii]|uniref:Cyclin N-terminal domain-containing protein 1 n=1 Tax=Myotis brandtii TaxID=109478 RepID=S7N8P4_MYOBR|nr:Cyclin N-terminal domain-containing protein 1 [Myotis brandtii]
MDGRGRPRLASVSEFQFGAVATETIEDALLHLAQQNEQAVQESAGWMGSFREPRIVGVNAGPAGSWVEGGRGHLSRRRQF